MKAKNLYLATYRLAGAKYHDLYIVWQEIEVGTPVRVLRDRENLYDPCAIAVVYDRKSDGETYLIGYIPASDNVQLYPFLEQGWEDMFECYVSKKDPEAHSEHQIEFTVRIKPFAAASRRKKKED